MGRALGYRVPRGSLVTATWPTLSGWPAPGRSPRGLIYNDYGGEGLNAKSNASTSSCAGSRRRRADRRRRAADAPRPPRARPPRDVAPNIRRLADLGLPVNISEMDVRVAAAPGTWRTGWRCSGPCTTPAGVCVEEPRCDAVTFWGFTDRYSWIDSRFGAGRSVTVRRTARGQAGVLRGAGGFAAAVIAWSYLCRPRRHESRFAPHDGTTARRHDGNERTHWKTSIIVIRSCSAGVRDVRHLTQTGE